jgi:hypothetical protein
MMLTGAVAATAALGVAAPASAAHASSRPQLVKGDDPFNLFSRFKNRGALANARGGNIFVTKNSNDVDED